MHPEFVRHLVGCFTPCTSCVPCTETRISDQRLPVVPTGLLSMQMLLIIQSIELYLANRPIFTRCSFTWRCVRLAFFSTGDVAQGSCDRHKLIVYTQLLAHTASREIETTFASDRDFGAHSVQGSNCCKHGRRSCPRERFEDQMLSMTLSMRSFQGRPYLVVRVRVVEVLDIAIECSSVASSVQPSCSAVIPRNEINFHECRHNDADM